MLSQVLEDQNGGLYDPRPCPLENTREMAHAQAGLWELGESPSCFGPLDTLPEGWTPCSMAELSPTFSCSPQHLHCVFSSVTTLASSPAVNPISICTYLCLHGDAERVMVQTVPGWQEFTRILGAFISKPNMMGGTEYWLRELDSSLFFWPLHTYGVLDKSLPLSGLQFSNYIKRVSMQRCIGACTARLVLRLQQQ